MSKRLLALIILIVAVIGLYGSYYVYASTVLVPEDIKTFKSDMNSIPDPVVNESELNEMQTAANQIENGPSLTNVPQSQRQQTANDLRSQLQPVKSDMQKIKENFTNNTDKALRYDLILKGNVATEMRSVYNASKLTVMDKWLAVSDNMANDYEKGDNKAFANDINEWIDLSRQIDAWGVESKSQLGEVVNQLGG